MGLVWPTPSSYRIEIENISHAIYVALLLKIPPSLWFKNSLNLGLQKKTL